MSNQDALFGDQVLAAEPKPVDDRPQRKRVLITVKAAPNPSSTHGETVCVAGIALDHVGNRGWIRLYPINFRHLPAATAKFDKYDLVTVDCKPARQDGRLESWKPNIDTLTVETHLTGWPKRKPYIEPLVTDNMCRLRRAAGADAKAPSLALIRPVDVSDFVVTDHPGWTTDEHAKIDAYVGQIDMFDTADKTPLEAPTYRGVYRWRCADTGCGGHNQSLIDWEFIGLQRNLRHDSPAEQKAKLRAKWLDEVCGTDRAPAFYVGNQAKRTQTFSILGVYWPRHTD